MKKDEINCELMRGVKVKFSKDFNNAWIVFLIYSAMVYTLNNRKDFEIKSGNAFCDKCWKQFEILLDEFRATVDHTRQHTLN